MFTKGMFVEWKSEDENGTFTHQGEVVDYSTIAVIIQTSPAGSTITIPQNDGTLREVPKPKEWSLALPKKDAEEPTSIKKPTTKRVRVSTGGPSKKEQAVEIYKSMMENGNHPSRKDVIARFQSDLDMTPAGASTYQNICKKECSA